MKMMIIYNEMQFKFRGFNVDLFNFYTGGISNYSSLLKYLVYKVIMITSPQLFTILWYWFIVLVMLLHVSARYCGHH
jgi:hypothetical protein